MPRIDQRDAAALEIPHIAGGQRCSARARNARDHRIGLRTPHGRQFGMGIGGIAVVGKHSLGHVSGKDRLNLLVQACPASAFGEGQHRMLCCNCLFGSQGQSTLERTVF